MIALCKCGVDMSVHEGIDELDPEDTPSEGGHYFSAAGTRHRCEKMVAVGDELYLCARPRYHEQELKDGRRVSCGGLTGEKLWE